MVVQRAKAALARFDAYQRDHSWVGFPFGVIRKFGEDGSGRSAALIAYYAFIAIFPLMMVLVTVAGIIVQENSRLYDDLVNSALSDFPIIGPQLRENIHALPASGLALLFGLLGMMWGAKGVAQVSQYAFNTVWDVPYTRRPGFPFSELRGLAAITVVGLGFLTTTALSGLAGSAAHIPFVSAVGGRILSIAVALVLNVGVFWLGFRLTIADQVPGRDLWRSAIFSAIGWQILQTFGSYLVTRQLKHSSAVYGTFGVVIGLLAWLLLQARITLYALTASVVRQRRLWPRSLTGDELTDADRRAYSASAKAEVRRKDLRVEVDFREPGKGR